MKITKDEIRHVADLARLELDEAAVEKFVSQIGDILTYVETLNRADTEGVVSTSHATSRTNAFREDQEKEHLDQDAVLSNAPLSEDGQFVVPKIVES